MQHSVWVAHYMNSNHIMENTSLPDAVPDGVLPKYLSFQRIWQGKGAQTAACKVLFSMYIHTYVLEIVGLGHIETQGKLSNLLCPNFYSLMRLVLPINILPFVPLLLSENDKKHLYRGFSLCTRVSTQTMLFRLYFQ